jgi:class 3 adenylate cyclase/predicted ATPase
VDVGAWLRGLGLERYERAFRDNDVDGRVLPGLTTEDLREIGVASIGHHRLMLQAIARLAAAATATPAQAATPETAAEPAQAERRQLTVMFVDLVGSTQLSTRLDPEEMREVLRAYQNAAVGEIARFGGYLTKFLGDGVLACFGWPRAHEDDAERAVRAGLAIAEAVARVVTPARERLTARVGIATGLVVAGDLIGEGAAREEAMVGETLNLAARLQEAAAPGAVVVAQVTRRLLGEVFELRPLGQARLKGFARPIGAFQILGERLAASRFEARRPGQPPPMVGRDQELDLVLERWRWAAAGDGRAVLLVGEAGIGKSRLVRAVLDALAGDRHTELRCQCSPHHTGTALWPVIRQLGFAAGLAPAEDDAAKLGKLEALLRQGAEDVSEAAPLVAGLLGIDPGDRYSVSDLTPQQRRARTLAVLVDQLLGLARRQPVLMVLEDAQWADPTTLELVEVALDRIVGARVLILLTSRPEDRPGLVGHKRVTRLTLDRLGRGPTEAMVARLAGERGLPPEVLGEIAARTDGVPLFVEELTKAVLEADATGAGAAVPASLQASLMARLDRVPGVRRVAQVAACIGREFPYALLAVVSPVPEAELRTALERLAAAELVFARGEPPEASYAFKHALVRDAAHESLLKSRRRQVHAQIAQVMEDHPSEGEDGGNLLAYHYTQAGSAEKAVDYRRKAARQALGRSAMAEAAAQARWGLELLGELPDGPQRVSREFDLSLVLGLALLALEGTSAEEAGRAFTRACELCRHADDRAEGFQALFGKWLFHYTRAELGVARTTAEEFLRRAGGQDDIGVLLTGYRIAGASALTGGNPLAARAYYEQALACPDAPRHQPSRFAYSFDARVVCSHHLAWALLLLGYPEQAAAQGREASARARELSHPATLALSLFFEGVLAQLGHDRSGAVRRAAEALAAFAGHQHLPFWSATGLILRGWALAADGRAEEGIRCIRQGMADYRATGGALNWPYFLALLADTSARVGRVEEASDLLADALAHADRAGEHWYEAELHRREGELFLCRSDPARAEACFRRALAVAGRQGAGLWELRATVSLARLWRHQDKRAEARDLLLPILGRFGEGLDTPDLGGARELLEALR